jgi:lipoate-protein ligase A
MKYITNNSFNPCYNLALEEYVLKRLPADDYIILWQNEPTVVIGKHQNAIEEINSTYIKEHGINVVRRITGGGAVYHDQGNLNFSFITRVKNRELLDFKSFTLPVVNALGKMGIEAELSGRNDITIEGKKISGNAQYMYKDRILHHGTLLFDSDLDVVSNALNVKADKIQSKGIKSVRSRVANIKEFLKTDMDINEFKKTIFYYLAFGKTMEEYRLNVEDIEEINRLVNTKYTTWEWTYGESPKFNLKNSKRFSGGKVEILLNIAEGFISECRIFGDFLSLTGVEAIENKLIGIKYQEEDISAVLDSFELSDYFGSISKNEILSCFFDFN